MALASNMALLCESRKNEGTYKDTKTTQLVSDCFSFNKIRIISATTIDKTHRNDTISDWFSKRFLSDFFEIGEHHRSDLLWSVDLLSFSACYLDDG